jgi:putative endonuclease
MDGGYVYIITNDRQTVLYTGSTNDLRKRIHHHRHRLIRGFAKKYNVYRLVYYEVLGDMDAARRREHQIKGMLRVKKEALINAKNPGWQDFVEIP